MLDQTFSSKSLLRLLNRGDPRKFGFGESKKDYLESLGRLSDAINTPSFTFSRFNSSKRPQGTLFTPTSVVDEFALRKINDNLKRSFHLSFSDRSKIVPQVITLLNEEVPYYVIKFDIKKFYENIDRKAVLERVFLENTVSFRTKQLLRKLFESPELSVTKGLPLGISVSATLAELYLEEFDIFCRRIPSVYYYVRYVDDILFFTYEEPKGIEEKIQKALPGTLQLNAKKCEIFSVDKKGNCTSLSGRKHLTFLGYDFHFRNSPHLAGSRLTVCISERKIKKIKTRIALSLFAFIKKPNYDLLKSRIAFLSSNFTLSNEKSSGELYSGIYYNYRFIDERSKSALADLDIFLCKALHSKTGSLGKKLSMRLNPLQRRELCQYSFVSGFESRILKRFSHPELREIKGIWSHA